MKRFIAIIVAAVMLLSLFGALSVYAAGGLSCLDFIYLLDEDKKVVETISNAKRNLGNISNAVQAKGAKYLRFQGWHSEDVEIEDIGYSLDGGDVIWGFAWLDEKLVANKAATQHEYPMRYSVDIPLTVGEDFEVELWYKLKDGEEDTFEANFVFTYSNKPAGDRFLSVAGGTYKFVDGDISPKDHKIEIIGADPAAKDWIGIFHAEGLDATDPEVDEENFTGWKAVVDGSSIDFNAAKFRQDGADDLLPGGYVVALLKNNSYDVISFELVNINAEAPDVYHFDTIEVQGFEPVYELTVRDLGDITAEFKDGHENIRLYGWAASDTEIKSIVYRYEDGREGEAVSKSRSDAATAAGTFYAMTIDILVPIYEGDMSFELLVKYADDTEEYIDTFYYICGDNVPPRTEKPTAEATEEPTEETHETEEATAEPAETPDEGTAAPTDKPADETDAPADKTAKPSGKKGCGSVVTGSVAMILLAGAMLVVRKKD